MCYGERMITVVAYQDSEGREPFTRWFADLDAMSAAKVHAALIRLAAGNVSEVKPVGSGVSERRIHWGPGYRVYFGQDGKMLVLLLAGGTKASQARDIPIAKSRWVDYRQRKRAGGSQ